MLRQQAGQGVGLVALFVADLVGCVFGAFDGEYAGEDLPPVRQGGGVHAVVVAGVGFADVGVVAGLAAGHGDVEEFAGEPAFADEGVAGVDGDSLGAVGGGGVAELGGLGEIAGAQDDACAGVLAGACDGSVRVGRVGDGDEGAVADEVAGVVEEVAVVAPGQDGVAAAGVEPVAEATVASASTRPVSTWSAWARSLSRATVSLSGAIRMDVRPVRMSASQRS